MDYTLALQLKNAGFLLQEMHSAYYKDGGGHWDKEEGRIGCMMCGYPFIEIENKVYRIPILSELIEACDNIPGTSLQKLENDGYGWEAYSPTGIHQSGRDPSEAVARLWLELHKK